MKKTMLFIVLLKSLILSSQTKTPLSTCDELREKIKTVYNSFDQLGEKFKNKETKKEGNEVTYSSKLAICGVQGEFIEKKYSSMNEKNLEFKFDKADYNVTANDFRKWGEIDILSILKDVFDGWKYDESKTADSESNGTYYTFIDKTKEVRFRIFELDDPEWGGITLTLSFKLKQY